MPVKNPFISQPVYSPYFADPFVWRADGVYYAVGTESAPQQGGTLAIPLIQSRDFWHWEAAGHVLRPPAKARGWQYWAPEVTFSGGKYYLYYSGGPGEK